MATAIHRKLLPALDSPEDSLEDMAKCLLSFENKFQWFYKVKSEIEERCGIITGNYWTDDDIRRAWDETQKMVKDYKRNQWAYVITFQEMKSSDDDENDSTEAEFDVTEREQEEQPCGSSQDSSGRLAETLFQHSTEHESRPEETSPEHSSEHESRPEETSPEHSSEHESRPEETLSEHSSEHESRPEEDMSESEKAPDGGFSATGINIPLSELFGSEATAEETATVPSAYKLINGCPSRREIRKKKTYIMSYNEETKNAEWVYEILNKQTLAIKNKVKGQFSNFVKVEGYDRGHLAAAANHRWCQEAYYGTFLFSNISPQISVLNQCMMNSLEEWCRKNITDKICNIHVYTGPIIEANSEDQRRNASEKAVPDSFFKVIIEENHDGTVSEPIGLMITNDETKLESCIKDKLKQLIGWADFVEANCKTSVEHIESVSKLKFCIRDVQMINEEIRSVTWTGEDGKGESCRAKIEVRIGK